MKGSAKSYIAFHARRQLAFDIWHVPPHFPTLDSGADRLYVGGLSPPFG